MDELQRDKKKGWHRTIRSRIPSCSSCSSWLKLGPLPLGQGVSVTTVVNEVVDEVFNGSSR